MMKEVLNHCKAGLKARADYDHPKKSLDQRSTEHIEQKIEEPCVKEDLEDLDLRRKLIWRKDIRQGAEKKKGEQQPFDSATETHLGVPS